MKNKVKLVVVVLLVSLICTGCWDKKEFNKISFADVLAIDRDDQEYILTLQLSIPKNIKEGGENAPLWVISGRGETILEAADDVNNRTPREIYWGHLNVVLIGKSVLDDDLTKVIDFFSRDNQLRKRNFVLATDEEAYKVLQAKTDLAAINNAYIHGLVMDQEHRVKRSSSNFNDVLLGINEPGLDLYLPKLEVISQKEILGEKADPDDGQAKEQESSSKSGEEGKSGNEGETQLSGQSGGDSKDKVMQINGAALIKEKKMVGWVDEHWTQGYHWIIGRIKQGIIVIESPIIEDAKLTVEVKNSKSKFSLITTDPLTLKVKITGDVNIVEDSASTTEGRKQELSIGKQKVDQLRTSINDTVKVQVEDCIKKAQELNCDPFGFGRFIYAYHPKVMDNVDWSTYMKQVKIEVEVDLDLKLALIMM